MNNCTMNTYEMKRDIVNFSNNMLLDNGFYKKVGTFIRMKAPLIIKMQIFFSYP